MEKLPLLHAKTRELIGIAEPVEAFAFDDPRGAMLSKQVDKARRTEIRRLSRSAPEFDTLEEGLRLAAQVPALPIAAPIARVGMSKEATAVRADRQRDNAIQAKKRQSRAMENTWNALKGDKQ